jgi:hypothetical protein
MAAFCSPDPPGRDKGTLALRTHAASAQNCVKPGLANRYTGPVGERNWRKKDDEKPSGYPSDCDNHACGHDGLFDGQLALPTVRPDSHANQNTQTYLHRDLVAHRYPGANKYPTADRHGYARDADQHARDHDRYVYTTTDQYPTADRHPGATDQYATAHGAADQKADRPQAHGYQRATTTHARAAVRLAR